MLRSLRPPVARRSLVAAGPRRGESIVTIAGGLTPETGVERLLQLVDLSQGEPVLVLPSLADRPASGNHPQVAVTLLKALGSRATVGLPAQAAMPVRRRWERLARRAGAQHVTLGKRGWDRVEFAGDGYRMDAAFVPAELTDSMAVIAIPALLDDALALGFWRESAHPHTRLRTLGTDRERMLTELSTVTRATYLLDASRLPGELTVKLLAWTDNPVAAELVGLGIRRYFEDAQGHETIGPWENARVQAAAELGHGPASGSAIVLRADASTDGVRAMAVYLADQLSCGIQWVTAES